MNKKVTILVCPLNWGLGHATRCIPIIRQLLLKNVNVIIAGSGSSFELLKLEFPQLDNIILEGYNIIYPRNGNMLFSILCKFPIIFYHTIKEHQTLIKIIKKNKIDAIISDNRFGLFSKRKPSIFITHQLMIKCPKWLKFLEPLLYLINNYFISRYFECWVPDYKGKINLSGDLSHKYPRLQNVHYIGPQSRLHNADNDYGNNNVSYDIMVILSGPEPQRSLLENIITEQLVNSNVKAIIVLGKPELNLKNQIKDNLTFYSYMTSDEIIRFMYQSKIIFCRSGYSSIMDLCVSGKKAILVPTPGQTEQEYLAKYFMNKKIFYSQLQQNLDIFKAIKNSEEYDGIKIKYNPSILNRRIDRLLEKIRKK